MAQPRPLRSRASRLLDRMNASTQQLLSHSLILYLLAVLAHRSWQLLNVDIVPLLNTDLLQLMRRLH